MAVRLYGTAGRKRNRTLPLNYKALNFGLVDETGEAVSEYRIDGITKHS